MILSAFGLSFMRNNWDESWHFHETLFYLWNLGAITFSSGVLSLSLTHTVSFSFCAHFMLPLVYSKWSYWPDSRIVKQVFPKWALSCIVTGMASVLPFASGWTICLKKCEKHYFAHSVHSLITHWWIAEGSVSLWWVSQMLWLQLRRH